MDKAWSPRGKYLWDFWFARRGRRVHAFYLQAERAACDEDPERRHDLASIGHAVRGDHGWQEALPALLPSAEPAWDDLSVWTGSILARSPSGPYSLFYTGRGRAAGPIATPRGPQRPQSIGLAVSKDLREWKRSATSLQRPIIPNPGPAQGFDGASWRDPWLLRECEGPYVAFVSTRLHADTGAPDDAGGVIAAVASSDLEHWGPPRIFVRSDDFHQLEVPQVFWRHVAGGKRCYLLFCAQAADCSKRRLSRMPASECRTGTYVMASDLLPVGFTGLPPMREPARLVAPGLYAGKLLDPESHGRGEFYGFPWADADGRFVGGIAGPFPATFDPRGELSVEGPFEAWLQ
jgi:beta-fructofuranosidase